MGADPEYLASLVREAVQGFSEHLGLAPVRLVEGEFLTRVQVGPQHLQQDGYVHAGVLSTLADHTAGYAAYSVVEPGRRILTIEFKINFLAPADAEVVECRGVVLKRGRQVVVTEAEVFALRGGSRTLCAKALLSMANVPGDRVRPPQARRAATP